MTDHSGVTEEIHKSGSILRLLESTDWPELQATPHRCFFGPPIRKGTPHFLLPLIVDNFGGRGGEEERGWPVQLLFLAVGAHYA